VLVEDRARDVNIGERFPAHKPQAGHHHARDPEKDNVARRHQHRSRIKGLKVFGLIGPTQRRKRPQRRRKPGVEHVLVLRQLISAGRLLRLVK
jgi:hypothetical protein